MKRFTRRSITPLGALGRGLLAGAIGAGIQTLFFKATRRIAPETPKSAFTPPESKQAGEMATETVARRFVEGFAQRGPLGDEAKRRGGEIVHFGFGAAWGGLYGLARESLPSLRGLPGALGFATLVWMVGDNLILTAFRLSAPPTAYPVKTHAYAFSAHLPYAFGAELAYEALRAPSWVEAGIALWALQRKLRARRLPSPMRTAADWVIDRVAEGRRTAAETVLH